MAPTVSDFVLQRFYEWGARRIFGYPGDGINGLLGALQRRDDGQKMDFVQVRHEEQAALMACAHAKFTGEVGFCLATSGPGAIHLLNGLYDAKADHVPVVALVGQASTMAIGSDYQQEVDLNALFKDVCEYRETVMSPTAARHVVDRAIRTALGMRGVACIIIPKDLQEEKAVESAPHTHNVVHSGIGYSRPRIIPQDQDLRRAAEVLNAGKKVAMLVGAGALAATDEVIAVADTLQAGIAKALLGKAAVPDDLPYVTGTIGLLGTRPSADMMRECDTLLMVGSAFPYTEFLPKEGTARGVQIEINPKLVGMRYPMEVNLIGDSADTLRALLPLLEQKVDASWRERLIDDRKEAEEIDAKRAAIQGDPLNPEVLFTELSRRLPDRAILTGDAGTATNWLARHVKMRKGMKFSLSGGLATMGSAVPYAIAAKFAYPDRVAIACTGDGAMQMNGITELLTVAKYWKRWSDPRLIFLVLNNHDLNQVTWEMRIMSGNPKYEATQDLPEFSYAKYAESLGFVGIRIDKHEEVGEAWERALGSNRPVVVEACTDPAISMLPAHITFQEATKFMSALSKGDPEGVHVIKDSIQGLIAGILPSRRPDEK